MDASRNDELAPIDDGAGTLDELIAARRRRVLETAKLLETQMVRTADGVSSTFQTARETALNTKEMVHRYRWWAVGGAVALGLLMSRRRQIAPPRAAALPLRPLWSAALTTFASIAAKEVASRIFGGSTDRRAKE